MFIQILSLTVGSSSGQMAAVEFAPFAFVAIPYVLLIFISVVLIKIKITFKERNLYVTSNFSFNNN